MEYTVGIDLEQDERFCRLLKKKSFTERFFTMEERAYLEKYQRMAHQKAAGIFCCKEAAAKALKKGLFGLHPQEIYVWHDETGVPQVTLRGSALRQFPKMQFSVSVSHSGGMTTAVVLAKES
ncbi:4'-phosphopantetheinyl transferase superfamily protein [Acidaminobacterium chupaoyuni]